MRNSFKVQAITRTCRSVRLHLFDRMALFWGSRSNPSSYFESALRNSWALNNAFPSSFNVSDEACCPCIFVFDDLSISFMFTWSRTRPFAVCKLVSFCRTREHWYFTGNSKASRNGGSATENGHFTQLRAVNWFPGGPLRAGEKTAHQRH
jgi:hypothetical protein